MCHFDVVGHQHHVFLYRFEQVSNRHVVRLLLFTNSEGGIVFQYQKVIYQPHQVQFELYHR